MRGGGEHWTTLYDVKTALGKKWQKGFFLKACFPGEDAELQNLFPLRITLTGPDTGALSSRFAEARSWISEYITAEEQAEIRVEWKEVNNRVLGRNKIPVAVLFDDLSGVARFLGKTRELSGFTRTAGELLAAFPALLSWVQQNTSRLKDLTAELARLIAVTRWITSHPRPGIYLRQLCVAGVNTKFLEAHKKTIGEWLDILLPAAAIDSAFTGLKGFEQRFGFLAKPLLVRFRYLDPHQAAAGFSDLTVRTDEFCRRPQPARLVFITENDINGLAFPPVPGGLIIFGRGYGFDFLREAAWLKEKTLLYWGDIDTHGFAILSQFRGIFPHTRSFLMDRETLLACCTSWSTEPDPSRSTPANLHEAELALLRELQENTHGSAVRLEQELIPFDRLEQALADVIPPDKQEKTEM